MASRRWYASAQTLADGSVFVASGSLNGLDPDKNENNNPTYEMLTRDGISNGKNTNMRLLEKAQPYHMYPFVHLLPDETLFVLADKSCQVFDAHRNNIVKELPDLPGLHRTYPTTGGSVLLPLTRERNFEPEIMVCGGGAYQDITSPTDDTCGRIKPLSKKVPKWEILKMPQGRGMVEGVLLLDGTVLWINGAGQGAEGFGLATDPMLEPLIYDPKASSWAAGDKSTIPRMYHSVALMLKDGTVLVTGSNPNEMPVLLDGINVNDPSRAFATEFRMERYTPAYLMGNPARPEVVPPPFTSLKPGQQFNLAFKTAWPRNDVKNTKVVLYHGGFVTHALHMGQRMVELFHGMEIDKDDMIRGLVAIYMPRSSGVVPPGPYWLFAMVNGVPSEGISVIVE